MQMRPRGSDKQGNFGKRGPVTLSPRADASPPSTDNGNMKWIGGGLAVVALMALIGGGTGGGGLLGGLIGGLIGHHLSKNMAKAPGPTPPATTPATTAPSSSPATHAAAARTPAPMAPTAIPSTTTVQRGGFGTTASSVGAGSHAGG